MTGLTELLRRAPRARRREIWLAICTAGDRTDAILHAFAFRAALGSDHLAHRGARRATCGGARARTSSTSLSEGAAEAGVDDVPVYEDELIGPAGDAARPPHEATSSRVTALGMRPELFAWLDERGATRLGPADVKRIVRRAAAHGS